MKIKNLLPLIVMLCCVFCAQAQSVFEHSSYPSPSKGIISNDSQFFIIGYDPAIIDEQYHYQQVSNPFYDAPYEQGFNPMNIRGFWADGKFHFYSDDNLSYYSCGDVIFQNFYISSYDPSTDDWDYFVKSCDNWPNPEDSLCSQLEYHGIQKIFFEIAPINSTDVFVLFEKSFLRLNDTTTGTKVSRPAVDAPLLFPTPQDAASFKIYKGSVLDSALLVFSNKAIFKYDLQGNLLATNTSFSQNTSQVLKQNDSTLLFVQGSSVFSINVDLITNLLFDYSMYFDSVILVKNMNSELWLMGTTANTDSTKFIVLDSSFNLSATYGISLDEVSPVEFRVDSNRLVIIGNEQTSPFGNDFSLATKSYNLDQLQDSMHNDTYVLSYDLDVYHSKVTIPGFFSGPYKVVKANLEVTIFNNSAEFVNSVIVAANFRESASEHGCHSFFGFYTELNNISIAPQSSQTFVIDSVTISTSIQDNLELCVWTVTPNGKIDKDHSNDVFCQQHIIISAKDLAFNQGVNFYPNPVDDILYLDAKEITGQQITARLLTIQGKVLMNLNLQNEVTPISLKHFPQGVYLLQIISGDKAVNHKVIKN